MIPKIHLIRPNRYSLEVLHGQSAKKQTRCSRGWEVWGSGVLEGKDEGNGLISLVLKTATGYRVQLTQRHYDAIEVARDSLIIPMNVTTEICEVKASSARGGAS